MNDVKYILAMETNMEEVPFKKLKNTKVNLRLFKFRFRALL